MSEAWITGAEAVTAAGGSLEETWKFLLSGKSAIRDIDRFPTATYRAGIGACIPGMASTGPASLIHAVLDLLLGKAPGVPADSMLITATTKAGIDNLEKMRRGIAYDPHHILPASIAENIRLRLGLKGAAFNVSAACASSTVAIARASALISSGAAESICVCSVDVITEFVFSGFSSLQILSPFPCKPFDRNRAGLSLGEGSAFLVLMSPERALREGYSHKTSVAGFGIANDAFHITAPDKNGAGLIRAIDKAMNSAGIRKEEIGGISAHGTGTIHNDVMELNAFRAVFGTNVPPFYSVKGCVGHTFGAAGGIEVALATRAIEEQVIPPTVGLTHPEEAALGLVSSESVHFSGDYLLTTNSGFGGVNAAILLKRSRS